MKIQFLGQNCFLFSYHGQHILTDPFYNFQIEQSKFNISSQVIHYMLITHAHGDHTADVKEVIEHYPEVTIIAQPEVCSYFDHQNNIDLNIGGSTRINGLSITMVQASHTSSFPDGQYGGVPCGYMLNFEGKTIYLSGDTGIMPDMALFPKLFKGIDMAILPIGGHYTMDAQQASFAANELLKTKKVIGCHFDTFPPIVIHHDQAQQAFKEMDVELILPQLGEVYQL